MGKADERQESESSLMALNPIPVERGGKFNWGGSGNLTPAAFASFASWGGSPRSAGLEAQGKARNTSLIFQPTNQIIFTRLAQSLCSLVISTVCDSKRLILAAIGYRRQYRVRQIMNLDATSADQHERNHSNPRSRSLFAASFGVRAPPFNHEWIFFGVTVCFIEV